MKVRVLQNRFKGAKIVFAGIVAWSYFVPTHDTLLFFDRMAVKGRQTASYWQIKACGLTICRYGAGYRKQYAHFFNIYGKVQVGQYCQKAQCFHNFGKFVKPLTSTPIIFIMGVSGTGKSTIGRMLSEALQLPFFDGDDYHPIENIRKMESGQPLTDQDRQGWLETLHALALREAPQAGALIACSALKQKYRDLLEHGLPKPCFWVFLTGNFETLQARMQARKDHFMPAHLLLSQLETLETPLDALSVDIEASPEAVVQAIINGLQAFQAKT